MKMPVKKICFFNTTPFWGGGEKWHFEAAQDLAKTKHQAFFVCHSKGVLAKKLAPLNVVQHQVETGNLSFLNPLKIQQLIQFFKTNQIETVIFNNSKDLKFGGRAAQKAGIVNIVYRRGIAVEVKKTRLTEYLFGKVVTHFIFNSKATKSLLQKNYPHLVAAKKTTILYNAIAFPPKTKTPPPDASRPIIIGNAGRLVPQKAQHFLIDIARELKKQQLNFKIVIAGEGHLKGALEKKINDQNLADCIELLGFVEDMPSFMHQIDIFVSTALWEGFGFVLAEAMVAQKPVLAYDVSSNPELIKTGENGYLIPLSDVDAFATKLSQLIRDEALRKKMGEVAYHYAKANFERQKQFEKLLAFV